jgi:muramoyltetrapeptide carboxypeptidase
VKAVAPSPVIAPRSLRLPRALPEPAVIGVCAPSGRVDEAAVAAGVAYLQELGHRVVLAEETRLTWRYFAGRDEERLAAFHRLVDDPEIDMIIAARGGYGLSRLIAHIDWNRVAASGKIYCGFSDFTAFNLAAHACANLLTFHGPMLAVDFAKPAPDSFAENHFWNAVTHAEHRIEDIACDHGYDARRIDGTLWGGNLALITHLVGTPYFPAIHDGILYVEDLNEEPYAVERMFMQLHHAGVLARQRALLLGDFAQCSAANTQRYPYSMEEVVESLRLLLPYPVLTNFPFGHIARKVTLPFGGPGTMQLKAGGYSVRFSGHLAR